MDCLSGSLGLWLSARSSHQGAIAGDWRAGGDTGLSISPSLLPTRQPQLHWVAPRPTRGSGNHTCCFSSLGVSTAAEDCSTPVGSP